MCSGTMAMASGALASPSFMGSKIRGAGAKVGSWPDMRRSRSYELRCGSQNPPGRRSLRSCNSGLAIVTPAKLVMSRWTSLVRGALQTELNVEESELKQALEKLRELVDVEGGNSEDADDLELLRFLRARSLDTQAAGMAFASHQKWREQFVPKGYFIEAELPVELDAKKAYWISRDKKGRPVLLAAVRNHVYNKNDFDQFKRFVVYLIERLIREAPPDAEQFICILDLKGLGLKNLDTKSFIAAFEILQDHYPLWLEKVFMVNVPFIFNGFWKIAKPFLDEDTQNRITFVDKKNLIETLTNEIDLEHLPKEYGGTADLVLLQDAVTSNWPPSS